MSHEKSEKEKVKFWFFGSPLIAFGNGALSFLQDIPGKKCFIVTDDFIAKNLLFHVTDKLKQYKKEYTVFDEVMPDPKEDMVLRGAEKCREYAPDIIIAVGGGSSIDTAKAIWILYEHPELNIDDMHPFMRLGMGKKSTLVAIPTTSGTGAETTWAIVITRVREDGSEIKLEMANREAVPPYAILDPVLTKGLPPAITASTAMDALSHSTEALISNFRNDFSDAMALKSIDLIFKYLPTAYKNGSDIRAREAVHNAACMAGLAFGNSQVVLGHSLGHALGAVFHKPHGLCVGTVIIPVVQFMLNNPYENDNKEILSNAAKHLGFAEWSDDNDTAVNKLLDKYRELMKEIDFPSSIKEWGISEEEYQKNRQKVIDLTLESTSYVTGDRPITAEHIGKVLDAAYEGKDVEI